MSDTVRLDREKFEEFLHRLRKGGADELAEEFEDAVVPKPTVHWGTGLGRRRHIVEPEARAWRGSASRWATGRALCGNFVTVRWGSQDATNTDAVMALQPCGLCVRAANARGVAL